jgi:hypothetical protein
LQTNCSFTANEAIWGGNKTAEGALKAMITDDPLPLELKNIDTTSIRQLQAADRELK